MHRRPLKLPALLAFFLVTVGIPDGHVRGQLPELAPHPMVGAYRTPTGGLLVVGSASEEEIRVRDLERGAGGVIPADGRDRYAREGLSIHVQRDPSGRVMALLIRAAGEQRRATPVPMRTEEITWRSGGIDLAGTLLLPAVPGPAPLVIVQPGSSWQDRYNTYGVFPALIFVASGTAALIYDKRGFGASGGDRIVGFEQTARDLAAAVEVTRLRFDVDPTKIGVFGLSQGGWIAPLAATLTDGIRFMALVGAPGTTPARQEIQRARAVLLAEGYPPEEVEAIGRFQETAFRYGRTGEGWDDYLAAREAAEGKGWLDRVWSPTEPGPDFWLWGRLNGDYNPVPALLQLRVPILAVWGENDVNVLPEVHRSIFETILDAAGNRDHTQVIVPHASHTLQLENPGTHPPGTLSPDLLGVHPFDRAAWELISDWITERTR